MLAAQRVEAAAGRRQRSQAPPAPRVQQVPADQLQPGVCPRLSLVLEILRVGELDDECLQLLRKLGVGGPRLRRGTQSRGRR